LDIFDEFVADSVCFFVEVVVDESHGFHRGENPVIELSFIIGELDFFAFVGGFVEDADVVAVMELCCEFAHFCFGDLAFAIRHVFYEFFCDDVLLFCGEYDLVNVVRHVESIK